MMAPVEFSSLSNHAISWESAALNAIDRIRIVSLSPTRENMLIWKGCMIFHGVIETNMMNACLQKYTYPHGDSEADVAQRQHDGLTASLLHAFGQNAQNLKNVVQ